MPYKDPNQQRAYQRNLLAARRQAWLQENGPCPCGSWKDLEVDHKDPRRKVDHKVWSWSAQRRAKELAKCQVLCRKCHVKKTAEWRARVLRHGTETMYHKGCRCLRCRQGRSARRKAYRAERKALGLPRY